MHQCQCDKFIWSCEPKTILLVKRNIAVREQQKCLEIGRK